MITRLLLVILLAPFLLTLAPASPAHADAPTRLRIGVVADGIYALTPADLAAAGLAPAAIDPRTFALSSRGHPVAIRVIGEADGRFDPTDSIQFFGQKFRGDDMAEKYTDENVYWLDIGGAPGPRIPEIDATPTGALTPPADFPAMMHAEKNNYWYTQHRPDPPTKESWYWDILSPDITQTVTGTYPGLVPYPAPGATATLSVEQNARAFVSHHTEISLNGLHLVDADWQNKDRSFVTAVVPAGLLIHDANTLSVHAITLPNVIADSIYFNYWELHYRRLFRAWEGRLDFTIDAPGPHEYQIDGWESGAALLAWDITDPAQPQHLTGFSLTPGASGQTLRFRAQDRAGSRYWLQTTTTLAHPASVRLRPPTNLRNPASGADVVIVTSPELRPAAERLAAFDVRRGYRVRVADFPDIVDEFNDGIYNPIAVTNLLIWAQTHWPAPAPHYLTLFGDGHWNFKGYNPALYPLRPQHIPPFLAWVDPWQGEVPADSHYADLDGDRLPDLAVGRISVETLSEAETVVAKIENYDEDSLTQPWQTRALVVADKSSPEGDYPAVSDSIITNYLPGSLQPQRIYLGQTVPNADAARQAIRAAIDNGAFMVQYTGHGAGFSWGRDEIWRLQDIAQLQNGSRLPLFLTLTCWDGYFVDTRDPYSIAEALQRQPNGGAIAMITFSGLGQTPAQTRMSGLLMLAMFRDGIRPLGDALLAAQRAFYAETGGPHHMVDTILLFGDPTLRIPPTFTRAYLPILLY